MSQFQLLKPSSSKDSTQRLSGGPRCSCSSEAFTFIVLLKNLYTIQTLKHLITISSRNFNSLPVHLSLFVGHGCRKSACKTIHKRLTNITLSSLILHLPKLVKNVSILYKFSCSVHKINFLTQPRYIVLHF